MWWYLEIKSPMFMSTRKSHSSTKAEKFFGSKNLLQNENRTNRYACDRTKQGHSS